MIKWFVKKVLGSKNQREVKRLWPLVEKINAIEEEYQGLMDEQLVAKTTQLKERFGKGETLDDLLPEAFAVVKNACRRLAERKHMSIVRGQEVAWEMIPFDVQLIGGMVLHSGRIAEMATGEGKTLVATFPAYLNALTGRGVHVVTVNDYLAARDSEWMGEVYRFLNLTVGCIQHGQIPEIRRLQYQADIVYGTNAEMGFDYLRDNGMATSKAEQVQRGHPYAIVDEVDSILIDEARTPLIIAGPATVSSHQYDKFKGNIERIVHAQSLEANRWAADARKQIEEGKIEEAGRLLFKIKNSTPTNKQLLKMIEEPELRRAMDDAELALYQGPRKTELYALKEEAYFSIDPKTNEADLSERGRTFLNPNDPDMFVLPDLITRFHDIDANPDVSKEEKQRAKATEQQNYDQASERIHNISQLLRAYCVYEKDVQYVVQENKVVIVDEYTGRTMPGRRWSDGLHQAVEAKEGVQIDRETQTLATITIQNYFRLYRKLAGMTGTAETEVNEFHDIYRLDVVVIPPNRIVQRKDLDDTIQKTRRAKYPAIIEEIKRLYQAGQPILVGTISVESSELISRMLKRDKIPHNVLNAKYHMQEAEIVSRAGQPGTVTISTNMAGRGTDIKLGTGVTDVGGLYVMGTERHESRRIDRQLRGRCARQGDPGSSHFFISLEDDLMRLFGSDRIVKLMERMGLEEGQELTHPLLNRSIQQAQKRVEGHNFQQRKRTLEYDDVMNKHRQVIYDFRNEIINAEDVRDRLMDIMEEVVVDKVARFTDGEIEFGEWKLRQLADWVNLNFPMGLPEAEIVKAAEAGQESPVAGSLYDGLSQQQFAVCTFLSDSIRKAYDIKISFENPAALKEVERFTILSAIDKLWQEHLYEMDSLRHSIGLRAHGQRDPLLEYKSEAFKIFDELMVNIKSEICHNIFRSASSMMAFENFLKNVPQQTLHQNTSAFGNTATGAGKASDVVSEAAAAVEAQAKAKPVRTGPKVGRNDPCPCGSGKKYKNCCGR